MSAGQRARGQLLEISLEHREVETGQARNLVTRGEQISREALQVELPDGDHAPLTRRRVHPLDPLRLAIEVLKDDLNGSEKARHPRREEWSALHELVELRQHLLKIPRHPFHVVRTLNAEQNCAINGALEETDGRKREMGAVTSGQEAQLRHAESSPQVFEVACALVRVVRGEVDAATGPELAALACVLAEGSEHEVALHGSIERQVEAARTIQTRL